MNKSKKDLFVVRQYSNKSLWENVTNPVSIEVATEIWNEKTNNGTVNTSYSHKSYYEIYSAKTVDEIFESLRHRK